MSGGLKANGFRLFLLLAAVFSYYTAVCQYRLLIRSPLRYEIVSNGETARSLTGADYENIREIQRKEASDLAYALWRKTDGLAVENPKWGRSSTVSMWAVRGSLDVLFSEFANLQEDDFDGCYLDTETAQELFGSTEVIGSEIACEGRTFTIRGVLREEKALLVVRPREAETTDRVSLKNAASQEVSSFQMRYGIEGTAVNDFFLRAILQTFLFLFPAVLCFRAFEKSCFRWIAFFFLLCFFFRQIEIPETMIPDKWSNFEFWSGWWEVARENIAAYIQQEKTGRELAQISCFLKGAICSVAPLLFIKG